MGVSPAKTCLRAATHRQTQRRQGKEVCHFDPFDKAQDKLREKSLFRARREIFFLAPSHSLGMTDRAPSPLRAWRPFDHAQDMLGGRKSEAPVRQQAQTGRKFAQAAQTFKRSS